jgi:O-acetyl-ADP-ribose deacetylase (regulator of RNase III)
MSITYSNKMSDIQVDQSNIIYKIGDLLNSSDQYIVHQCNCTSSNYKGLSKAIVEKFPYATFYAKRNRIPGTIEIKGDGINERFIIGMFAQNYTGLPLYNNDTYELRLKWFASCLDIIALIPDIKSIGFPYNIGCGLAGGDWKDYLDMIKEFAKKNKHVIITIYEIKSSEFSLK